MSERDDSMDEVIQEFLVESGENLDHMDRDLVSLEKDPTSRQLLGSVFRAVHTIKGTTGFLGFSRLEQVAHRAENLLSKLRDGTLPLDSDRTTALLDVVDVIRSLLAHIEAAGDDEDGGDFSELLGRLSSLQLNADITPDTPDTADKAGSRATGPFAGAPAPAPAAARGPAESPSAKNPLLENASLKSPAGSRPPPAPSDLELVLAGATAPPEVLEAASAVGAGGTPSAPRQSALAPPAEKATGSFGPEAPSGYADGPRPRPINAAPLSRTDGAPLYRTDGAPPAAGRGPSASVNDRTVRVDIELLDTLMRQVGELVLARNQLISHAGELTDGGRSMQRLSLIVSELQEDVMKTRMQPVEQLWSKLPRVVRDLAKQFGKEVNLSLNGGDTELDRSVLEAVKDPLTHLVRNAMDHGIEAPDVREAAAKPRAGTLTLSASHQGGLVILEMSDDGAGIDARRVAAKALAADLVTEAQLEAMTAREVTDLVFRPGFSTAEVVTNVSGRGVGMDVVRTNIEHIGGNVDLVSRPGQGTTVRIKIPLTLAIIPALLVVCGGERFAVPQAAVQELVRLEGEGLARQVESVDGALIYRLRGRLLPLLRLDQVLGRPSAPIAECDSLDVVVVQADGEPFAMAVDAIEGTQEIVVKPLARQLKHLAAYAGATILGDGSVALILDIAGLAETAGIAVGRAPAAQDSIATVGERAQALLVLRVGEDRRVALPLEQVARLEELSATTIEHAGTRQAIQYRGDLLPLAWLGEVLGVPSSGPGTGRLSVVVCSDGEHSVGLVVEQIIDVVTEVVSLSEVGTMAGVLGTAVLQGRATDLLDLPVAARYAGVPFARTVDLSLRANEEVADDAR